MVWPEHTPQTCQFVVGHCTLYLIQLNGKGKWNDDFTPVPIQIGHGRICSTPPLPIAFPRSRDIQAAVVTARSRALPSGGDGSTQLLRRRRRHAAPSAALLQMPPAPHSRRSAVHDGTRRKPLLLRSLGQSEARRDPSRKQLVEDGDLTISQRDFPAGSD